MQILGIWLVAALAVLALVAHAQQPMEFIPQAYPDMGEVEQCGAYYCYSVTYHTLGREIWRVGDATGTQPIHDIVPGIGSSNPRSFVNIGGRMLFLATDPMYGEELYSTSGTEDSLQFIGDLTPGSASTSFDQIVAFGGAGYFYANDGVSSVWYRTSGIGYERINGSDGGSTGSTKVCGDGVYSLRIPDLTKINSTGFYSFPLPAGNSGELACDGGKVFIVLDGSSLVHFDTTAETFATLTVGAGRTSFTHAISFASYVLVFAESNRYIDAYQDGVFSKSLLTSVVDQLSVVSLSGSRAYFYMRNDTIAKIILFNENLSQLGTAFTSQNVYNFAQIIPVNEATIDFISIGMFSADLTNGRLFVHVVKDGVITTIYNVTTYTCYMTASNPGVMRFNDYIAFPVWLEETGSIFAYIYRNNFDNYGEFIDLYGGPDMVPYPSLLQNGDEVVFPMYTSMYGTELYTTFRDTYRLVVDAYPGCNSGLGESSRAVTYKNKANFVAMISETASQLFSYSSRNATVVLSGVTKIVASCANFLILTDATNIYASDLGTHPFHQIATGGNSNAYCLSNNRAVLFSHLGVFLWNGNFAQTAAAINLQTPAVFSTPTAAFITHDKSKIILRGMVDATGTGPVVAGLVLLDSGAATLTVAASNIASFSAVNFNSTIDIISTGVSTYLFGTSMVDLGFPSSSVFKLRGVPLLHFTDVDNNLLWYTSDFSTLTQYEVNITNLAHLSDGPAGSFWTAWMMDSHYNLFTENGKSEFLPFPTDYTAFASSFWSNYGTFLVASTPGFYSTLTPCTAASTCNSGALCHSFCDTADTHSCQASVICPVKETECSVFTPTTCCQPGDNICINGPSKSATNIVPTDNDPALVVPWIVSGVLFVILVLVGIVAILKRRAMNRPVNV